MVRLAAAVVLWENYPDCQVGDFAAIRSVLVSDRVLAQVSLENMVWSYIC